MVSFSYYHISKSKKKDDDDVRCQERRHRLDVFVNLRLNKFKPTAVLKPGLSQLCTYFPPGPCLLQV